MLNAKKQKLLLIIVALLLTVLPALALAHGLVPCGGTNENPCTVQDLFSLIARVTNWLISVAGIYAVFQIVNAGFWLTVSMGNEESISKWKSALSEAVVGFVLVMAAFLLINTVINYVVLDGAPQCAKVDLAQPISYFTNTCP